MPASATRMRREPSNWKGLVTTATVRMPNSLATRAITEAAPVPVPPPMPAAMNTMWAAGERGADVLERLLRGGLADFGFGAGAEAFREARAELDAHVPRPRPPAPGRRCWRR